MKLPNGGAKIMLERRNGLFFLPVYRTDAKAAPGLVSQSTVTVASLASGSVERDTSGNDVVEEEHVQAQPDSFWQQFVDKVPKQVVTNSKPLRNSDFRKRAAERGISHFCMASFERWHQRLRHVKPELMEKYRKLGIKGFDVSGNKQERKCDCSICRLVKSRVKGQNRASKNDPVKRVGQRVSTAQMLLMPCFSLLDCLESSPPTRGNTRLMLRIRCPVSRARADGCRQNRS